MGNPDRLGPTVRTVTTDTVEHPADRTCHFLSFSASEDTPEPTTSIWGAATPLPSEGKMNPRFCVVFSMQRVSSVYQTRLSLRHPGGVRLLATADGVTSPPVPDRLPRRAAPSRKKYLRNGTSNGSGPPPVVCGWADGWTTQSLSIQ